MNQKILEIIDDKKAVFFIGAGVSMIPPSSLPSWWEVNHIILDSLTNLSSSINPEIHSFTNSIKLREEEGKLPPEYVSEIISDRIGESYFEVLQGLEGDIPNQIHLWLATLAKIGKIKLIITTNFDTLIEKAFKMVGASIKVYVDPKEYKEIPKLLENSNEDDNSCLLLKLHGTATRPETCIDTLKQRKQGLDHKITQVLNIIGKQNFWIFLGYSGADLDAEPNYLGLRHRMNDSPGYLWLFLENAKPPKAVIELSDLYGNDRGIIDYGTLPNWLDNLKTLLPNNITPPKEFERKENKIEKLKQEKLEKIKNYSLNWAKKRGEIVSLLILIDIGYTTGLKEQVRSILEDLMENIDKYKMNARVKAILFNEYGKVLRNFNENQESISYYEKAMAEFKIIEDKEGYITSVYEISKMQQLFGEYLKAEKNMEEVVRIWRENNDYYGIITSLLGLGILYNNLGKFQEALDTYNEAIELSIKNGEEFTLGLAYSSKSLTESELGNIEIAEKDTNKAIEIFSRLYDDELLSKAYRNLASLNFDKGENELAIKNLKLSKEKAYLSGDKEGIARAKLTESDFKFENGDYSGAYDILIETNSLINEVGDAILIMDMWEKMGLAVQFQGNFGKAIEIYNNALIEANKLGLEGRVANIYNNLGILLEQQGRYEEALKNYLKSYENKKKAGQIKMIANSTANIGNLYYRMERLEDALKYYTEALEIFQEIEDIPAILTTKANIINITVKFGDLEKAIEQYNESIQLAEKVNKIGLRDITMINLAGVYFSQENYEKAVELYTKVKNSSIERKDYNLAGMACYYLSLSLLRVNDVEKAKEIIQDALNYWNEIDNPNPLVEEAQKLLDYLNNPQ